MSSERSCLVCGCTDSRACAGGCSWKTVESAPFQICSNCWPADCSDGTILSVLYKVHHAGKLRGAAEILALDVPRGLAEGIFLLAPRFERPQGPAARPGRYR